MMKIIRNIIKLKTFMVVFKNIIVLNKNVQTYNLIYLEFGLPVMMNSAEADSHH